MSKTATFNKPLALLIGALARDRLKLNTEEFSISKNIGSDYQEIQIRTLTKWVNAQLRQVNDSIADITTDLRDGIKLLKLLSVVAGDAPKPERMNMRIHQLANVAQALNFLERTDIGNEAIVNGDVKKTLALISFIMVKYQIQLVLSDHGPNYLQSLSKLCEQENGMVIDFSIHLPPVIDKLTLMMEAKSALLYWIHIQLNDYITANIIPIIQDFSRSWASGVAFCLLIHCHNSAYIPDLFTNHLITQDKNHLLQVAFDLANQHMGIERYIEPKDLLGVEYPHEPTVMMYVSEYYKVMSAYQRQEADADKKARAAKRKAAIILASIGKAEQKDGVEEELVQEEYIAHHKETKEDTPLTTAPLSKLVRKSSTISRPLTQQHLQEEKAKIKKDLKMQLTGHLTKGVHPLLDTLLTIHDTLLAYIKWNTQKIDEIPMEFTDSCSVSKYLGIMESIQEQAHKESAHLSAAKDVQERLTSKDTVLTQLQQSQVIKMYTVIETEWKHFVDLIESTKQELSTVRNTLAQIEKDVQDYEAHTITIENALDTLLEQLSQIEPSQKSQLDAFSEELHSFEKNSWCNFIQHSNRLTKAVMPNTNIQEKHDSLISGLAKRLSLRRNLERSHDVSRMVKTLETELEEIQYMKATPENMQALESKLSHARSIVYSIQQDYGDLEITILLSDIQEKYEIVSNYIDQIRVWFIEAERVQSWIEQQITTITERNAVMEIDPLDQHFVWKNWSTKDIETLYNEHEVFRRDIERFNEQDMKRLRSHVRQVMDQHLSPSDAATIETTLSTLNSLDRMNKVLQKRTDMINLLKMRVQWETLFEKAMDWIDTKDKTITYLVVHKARWSESKMADEIAQTLVDLENEISSFNTDEYACILDVYQEMESVNVDLPQHLEQRQEELESRFEYIVKKCEFLRSVVEQFLAVSQVMEQFNRLKLEGNKLTLTLANQASSAFDQSFNESVYTFKDGALQWVTTWMKAVPYTTIFKELEELEKVNEQANQKISSQLNECAMELAKTTVKLENLLLTSQQSISLQHRAELVYENLMHATTWIQEHLRLIQKYDCSLFEQDFTSLELTRLEKEFESINSKREYLETHNIKHVLESVHAIEKETDSLDEHASLDRKTLSSGVQKLKNLQETLKKALAVREKEISVSKKQIAWKMQCENLKSDIDQAIRIFSEFGVEFANSQVNQLQEKSESTDQLWNDLHVKLSLEYQKVNTSFESVNDLFKKLKDAYDDLSNTRHSTVTKDIPNHVNSMQAIIEERYQNVQEVYKIIENMLIQHNTTIDLIHETENLQSEAEPVLTAAVQLKRTISASLASKMINEENACSCLQPDNQIQIIDQLHMIMTKINIVYGKGLSIKCMSINNCTDPVLSQTLAKLEYYHGQTSLLVAKRLDMLTCLKETVESYLDFYSHMYTISSSTMEYRAKLEETGNILDKILLQICEENFDVADALVIITPERISSLRSRIDELLEDFTHLKTTRIVNLQHQQQARFCNISLKSIEENIQHCCDKWYANLEQKLVLVEESLETQLVIVEIAEKRLIWELQLQENETQLGLLNSLLYQHGFNTEKNVALGTVQLESLAKQHSEITKQIQQFLETDVLSMKSDFESMEQSFRKHPLLTCTPLYLQDKMYFFGASLERLNTALSSQSQVLNYLHQKLNLEDRIKEALLDLEYQKSEISAFIQQRGRWFSNNEEESAAESDNQLSMAKGRFETYYKTVLTDIQTSYSSLKKTSSSLDSEIIRNADIVNFAYLMQMEAHIEADIAFAKEVLQWKKRVNKFINQATILEKEAGYISEILLSRSPSESPLPAHEQKVDNFKMKICNLETALKDDIHFPKRSNQNDITMTMQISDKIMESSVEKFLYARIRSLNAAEQGLSRLLVAQETRAHYMLQLFTQQINICQSWISSMCSTLETSVLEGGDSSKDSERVIEAIVAAEVINALMSSHDNNFTLLCKYKDKYAKLNAAKSCEYTIACENFEKVKLQWSDLLVEAKEISQALFSAILPMDLHCRASDLVSSCKKLINDMESTDRNCITSECFSNWQTRISSLEFQKYKKLSYEVTHDTTAYMEEPLVTKLKQAGDFIFEARAIQSNLYHSINASRLRSTYADNLELFQKVAANIASLVDGSKFSKKTPGKHAEASSVHEQIKNKYLECHYLYLELCCPVEPETQATQTNLETMWRTVQNKHADFANNNVADLKWVHGCHQVDKISESLKDLKSVIDTVTCATAAKEEIQKVEKQISKYFSGLEHAEIFARNDTYLDSDEEKRNHILSQIRNTREIGIEFQEKVDLCKSDKSKQALLDTFSHNITKTSKICKDQLAFLQQQANINSDLKKPKNLNSISAAYSTALSHIQVKKRVCENIYNSFIMDQADELVNVYGHSSTEIYAYTSRLDQLLKDLGQKLDIEIDYTTSLHQLKSLIQYYSAINSVIMDLKSTIHHMDENTGIELQSFGVSMVDNFENKYDSISRSIEEFYKKCDTFKCSINENIGLYRQSEIINVLSKREEILKKLWVELEDVKEETIERLKVHQKHQVTALQLSKSLGYARYVQDRIKTYQMSSVWRTTIVEDQELDEIANEIKNNFAQLPDDSTSFDKHHEILDLQHQKEKLSLKVKELHQSVLHCRTRAQKERQITEFYTALERIDTEMFSFLKSLADTSLSNSKIVDFAFKEDELRRILDALVSTFEEKNKLMEKLLGEIESKGKNINEEEIICLLNQTMASWSLVKYPILSRKQDLHSCIQQLDHKFYTRLALADLVDN